jgi:hypothetical protein
MQAGDTNYGIFYDVMSLEELQPSRVDVVVDVLLKLLIRLAIVFVVQGRDLEDVPRGHTGR